MYERVSVLWIYWLGLSPHLVHLSIEIPPSDIKNMQLWAQPTQHNLYKSGWQWAVVFSIGDIFLYRGGWGRSPIHRCYTEAPQSRRGTSLAAPSKITSICQGKVRDTYIQSPFKKKKEKIDVTPLPLGTSLYQQQRCTSSAFELDVWAVSSISPFVCQGRVVMGWASWVFEVFEILVLSLPSVCYSPFMFSV